MSTPPEPPERAAARVRHAALAHAERLRWLGYPEQVREAEAIEAAVERMRDEYARGFADGARSLIGGKPHV